MITSLGPRRLRAEINTSARTRRIKRLALLVAMTWSGVGSVAGAATQAGTTALAADDNSDAALVYNLTSIGVAKARRLYLKVPDPAPVKAQWCLQGATCRTVTLSWLELINPDVLADRKTRLTLIWSAIKKPGAVVEVGLLANDDLSRRDPQARRVRRFDLLRAGDGSASGRRLVLDVPALSVHRNDGICIEARIAWRGEIQGSTPVQLAGLELEMLP